MNLLDHVKDSNRAFPGKKVNFSNILNKDIKIYDYIPILTRNNIKDNKNMTSVFVKVRFRTIDLETGNESEDYIATTSSTKLLHVLLQLGTEQLPLKTKIVEESFNKNGKMITTFAFLY